MSEKIRPEITCYESTTELNYFFSPVRGMTDWQVFASVTELVNFYHNNGVELLGDSRRNLQVHNVKLKPF